MITAVEIENFKGIRDRTRIEIKPITLLFGPNSAGKSTLLHALQLAREVFTRRNLDVDVTDGGAGFIDLGGFRNYVHGRDPDSLVTLRFDLDLSQVNFLREYPLSESTVELPGPGSGEPDFDLSSIGDEVQTGWVEIKIGWQSDLQGPYIAEYSVGINDNRVATIMTERSTSGLTSLRQYDVWHPLLRWPNKATVEEANGFGLLDHLWPGVLSLSQLMYLKGDPISAQDLTEQLADEERAIRFADQTGFPDDRAYRIIHAYEAVDEEGDTRMYDVVLSRRPDSPLVRVHSLHFWIQDYCPPGRSPDEDELEAAEAMFSICLDHQMRKLDDAVSPALELRDQLDALPELDQRLSFEFPTSADYSGFTAPKPDLLARLLSRLLLVPARALRTALKELRYVGPIRDTVPRNFEPPRFPDPRRWAGGLAAWDELARHPDTLIPVVSEWLGKSDRLNTGYEIRVSEIRKVPASHEITYILGSSRPLHDMGSDELKAELQRLLEGLELTRQVTLVALSSGQPMHPADVGQGITQSVPVVVAALAPFGDEWSQSGGLVAIEQPELHLHPAVQVGLGDLFITAAHRLSGHRLLIETHSEHLLLRLLRRIRQTAQGELPPDHPGLRPDRLAIICFEPPGDGHPTRVYRLRVSDEGEFLDRWPRGFFDERAEELFGP
jgi:hypothetical protein